jgi:hypothetical protein
VQSRESRFRNHRRTTLPLDFRFVSRGRKDAETAGGYIPTEPEAPMSSIVGRHSVGPVPAHPGAERHGRYFAPYLTRNERLIWTGRSSACATFRTFAPVWWISLPGMGLCWLFLPHAGPGSMPFLIACGLSAGPPLLAVVARYTFFALTQRRALFLMRLTPWHRVFATLDLNGSDPWLRAAPCSTATVFLGNVGRPTRRKRFVDGYGNMGFWRIADAQEVADIARRIGASRRR